MARALEPLPSKRPVLPKQRQKEERSVWLGWFHGALALPFCGHHRGAGGQGSWAVRAKGRGSPQGPASLALGWWLTDFGIWAFGGRVRAKP
jgi:hypothetical protein